MATRELLVGAIVDLAGDEYDTIQSVIELAKESEEKLIARLVGIACYYRDEANS